MRRETTWNRTQHYPVADRAQRVSRRELGIVHTRTGGVVGIACAGEVLAHVTLSPDALEELGMRALEIASAHRQAGGRAHV